MRSESDVPSSLPLNEWLARLAEPTGAPGGGSAAAVLLAVGAGLVSMVGGYSDGDVAAAVTARAGQLRERLLGAGRADGRASAELGAQLASGGDDRDRRVAEAAVAAASSSLDVAALGEQIVRQAAVLADVGDPNLDVDTAVALHALRAGVSSALLNVRENTALARRHRAPESAVDEFTAALREAQHTVALIDDLLATLDRRMRRRANS
jgi:formiminotetrahydrofolate cyclodeaminase